MYIYYVCNFIASYCTFINADVDECAYKLDKCEDKCTNTPGGYKCSCPYGQVLASNGYSCIKCAKDKSGGSFSQISPALPVRISDSPWHVAVCKENSTICSGSLINDNSIVTTANCVCSDNSTTAEMLSVMMNNNYGCPYEEHDAVEYSVSKIICHPSFKPASLDYNIAVLKLTITVNTSSPICLPASKDLSTFSVNSFAGIYDFGKTDNFSSLSSDNTFADENTEMLQLQVTQIVSVNECGANYTKPVSRADHILCTCK